MLDAVAQTFDPNTVRQIQADPYEFKTSLVCVVSARPTQTVQEDPVSKKR